MLCRLEAPKGSAAIISGVIEKVRESETKPGTLIERNAAIVTNAKHVFEKFSTNTAIPVLRRQV